MYNYKLIVAYDGTRYLGWQKQLDDVQKTIQGKLENVLSLLFDEPIQVIASGRTDAGVHAQKQVANFHTTTQKELPVILDYLKQYLPKDIAVVSLTIASPRFHARYNCISKKYVYTIDTASFANPFMTRYAYHVDKPLDLKKMENAAALLVGTHDFKSFTSLKSKKKSTIKTIHSIDVSMEGSLCKITYHGNGFLQHMVRILSGTLIEVGIGHLPVSEITTILEAQSRPLAGPTAPAHGLCLQDVHYD